MEGGFRHEKADSVRSLVRYLESLTLTGGDLDGEPFTVLPWERQFLAGAFAQPGNAAISVARGNGKSALVAGIASAVVDPVGPLTGTRREVVCVATSFMQARIVFEDVLAFLGAKYDLDDREMWRKQDSAQVAQLDHRPTGARVRVIGCEPSTAHGMRPFLALLDEPAQWQPAKADKVLAAVRTGLGKVPNSRMIALGTRPSDSGHWFAQMLAGNGVGYSQTHAARPGDPPGHRRTWKRANPSLDVLPSLEAKIREEWADAKRNPSLLPSFKALRLNGGVSDVEEAYLIEADVWLSCEGVAEMSGPPVWGIDMGGSAAMTAVAAFWPASGALSVVASFPSVPSLDERGIRDGVAGLYRRMAERGELLTTGGRATDTVALLKVALERFGSPAAVTADRWRADDLRDALDAAGVRRVPFVERGMGFKDGGQDTDAFRRAVADGRVVAAPSLLLRSAVAEARVLTDPAGNTKLSKATQGGRRLRARDDAAAAAMLAVAVGSRGEVRTAGRYLGTT